jgi:hypothetical protein
MGVLRLALVAPEADPADGYLTPEAFTGRTTQHCNAAGATSRHGQSSRAQSDYRAETLKKWSGPPSSVTPAEGPKGESTTRAGRGHEPVMGQPLGQRVRR